MLYHLYWTCDVAGGMSGLNCIHRVGQGQQTFFVKGQIVNILGSAGQEANSRIFM